MVRVIRDADPPLVSTVRMTEESSSARLAAILALQHGHAHTEPHVTRPAYPAIRSSPAPVIRKIGPPRPLTVLAPQSCSLDKVVVPLIWWRSCPRVRRLLRRLRCRSAG